MAIRYHYRHKTILAYKEELVRKIKEAKEIAWRRPEGAEDLLAEAIAIILADWSGPIAEREQITGLSTRGKNKNFGNSGFAGGCTLPAGYAGE